MSSKKIQDATQADMQCHVCMGHRMGSEANDVWTPHGVPIYPVNQSHKASGI